MNEVKCIYKKFEAIIFSRSEVGIYALGDTGSYRECSLTVGNLTVSVMHCTIYDKEGNYKLKTFGITHENEN